MNDPLMRLGHLAAEQTDETEAELRVRRVRTRLQDSLDVGAGRPASSMLSPGRGFVFSMVVTLALSVGVFSWLRIERPIEVYAEAQSGELTGQRVSSKEGTKQLQFSDGTRLSLHPQTVVHVAETTPRGASMRLERGRLFASIIPDEDADWLLRAGPYTVRVTGTEFELSWDAEKEVLELAMHRGSVILTGPGVDGERSVQGSEFVRVGSQNEEPIVQPDVHQQPSHEDLGPESAVKEVPSSAEVVEGSEESKPSSVAPSSRTAEQLWSEVRRARAAGEGEAARSALLLLRNRHGARGQTAYLLGRVHAEQLGSRAEAIHWFQMYLKESPGGALSEQSWGRLIELQAGTAAGKKAAATYLEKYPRGSYAGLARSVSR